jgi:hypothetical protein
MKLVKLQLLTKTVAMPMQVCTQALRGDDGLMYGGAFFAAAIHRTTFQQVNEIMVFLT